MTSFHKDTRMTSLHNLGSINVRFIISDFSFNEFEAINKCHTYEFIHLQSEEAEILKIQGNSGTRFATNLLYV